MRNKTIHFLVKHAWLSTLYWYPSSLVISKFEVHCTVCIVRFGLLPLDHGTARLYVQITSALVSTHSPCLCHPIKNRWWNARSASLAAKCVTPPAWVCVSATREAVSWHLVRALPRSFQRMSFSGIFLLSNSLSQFEGLSFTIAMSNSHRIQERTFAQESTQHKPHGSLRPQRGADLLPSNAETNCSGGYWCLQWNGCFGDFSVRLPCTKPLASCSRARATRLSWTGEAVTQGHIVFSSAVHNLLRHISSVWERGGRANHRPNSIVLGRILERSTEFSPSVSNSALFAFQSRMATNTYMRAKEHFEHQYKLLAVSCIAFHAHLEMLIQCSGLKSLFKHCILVLCVHVNFVASRHFNQKTNKIRQQLISCKCRAGMWSLESWNQAHAALLYSHRELVRAVYRFLQRTRMTKLRAMISWRSTLCVAALLAGDMRHAGLATFCLAIIWHVADAPHNLLMTKIGVILTKSSQHARSWDGNLGCAKLHHQKSQFSTPPPPQIP